jgi:uncharacterized protein YbjT (DUF2867 family)
MIVITGATGFVGREVLRQARAEGHAVRAIVREPDRARWLAERHGVELFHGNVLYAPSLEGAMDGANCLIHLVGIIRPWKENTFERAHVEATRNVLETARKARVKRYLHMSALGTRPDAPSRYHQTKWAAEELVRKSGLAWTIFRPSVIYGAGDNSIRLLARLIRWLPVLPVLGDGNAKIQPVQVEVVARALVRAIKNDASIGKVYELCGPEPFSWNELYEKLMALYGVRKAKLHIPVPLARVLAAVLEKLLPNPPFTRDQLLMLEEDNVGDPKPAEQDLALEQDRFEHGIARYLKPPP